MKTVNETLSQIGAYCVDSTATDDKLTVRLHYLKVIHEDYCYNFVTQNKIPILFQTFKDFSHFF